MREEKIGSSFRKAGFASIIVLILFTAGIIKALYFYHPKTIKKSEEYSEIASCPVRHYEVLDNISSSCIRRRYLIPYQIAVFSYGWQAGRAGRDYYRVGDDAYQIRCDENNPQNCVVMMTQYSVFKR